MLLGNQRTCITTLWLFILLCLLSGTANAAVYNVTKTADTQDGLCDADCSLREALTAATSSSDTVNVPAGIYILSHADGDFDLNTAGTLTINGAGIGSTIIDGNNASRIFQMDWNQKNLILSGMTLRNGTDSGDTAGGGCIRIRNTNLTLTDVEMTSCTATATNVGGALYKSDNAGAFTFNGTIKFTNNTAGGAGGAVFTPLSTTFPSGSVLTGNTAVGNGGAVYISVNTNTVTVINATISGNTSNGANGGGALYSAGSVSSDGSTFDNNHAPAGQGGAIYAAQTLTLSNAHQFTNNSAAGVGGAIRANNSLTIPAGSILTGNSSGNNGGAVYVASNTQTITAIDSTISNNIAGGTGGGGALYSAGYIISHNSIFDNNQAGGSGGALYAKTVTLNAGSEVTNNTAAAAAGGIYSTAAATLSMTDSVVSGNTANGGDGGGVLAPGYGAIYNISGSDISNNTATGQGGGLYVKGTANLTDTSIIGNSAGGNGGGVAAPLGLSVTSSTIANNSGATGGGSFTSGGSAISITNSTYSGNSATADGAAIAFTAYGSTCYINSSTIYNNSTTSATGGGVYCSYINTTLSILAGNTAAGSEVNCDLWLGNTSGGYNLEGASSCGFISEVNGDQVNTDPKLKVLGNYGGPTQTHEPQSDSPAIDAGDNTLCAAAPINNLDQRGVARPMEGDGFAPNTCDIGAVEYKLYLLRTAAAGGGSVTSSPGTVDCYSGSCYQAFSALQTVTLTATPHSGYLFSQWSGACSGSGTCVVTMDGDKDVVAVFTPTGSAQTLSTAVVGAGKLSTSYGGVDCPDLVCSVSLTQGTAVTVTPTAGPGYVFDSWSGDCSGAGACDLTLDVGKSVTATFTIVQYPLTVNVTGSGSVTSNTTINCPGICSENLDYNTAVTLNAAPGVGYEFLGWSGACIGHGACNVTMAQAKNVSATFVKAQFPLNVIISGASGTVTGNVGDINCTDTNCADVYDSGTQVTLVATPTPGYGFTGWTGDCSGLGFCAVTLDVAKTVTANFAIDTYGLTVTKGGGGTGTVTAHDNSINCGATCSALYDANRIVTLTATPDVDNQFDGWSGAGCSGTWICNVTLDQAQNVTATFSPLVAGAWHVTKFIDTKDGTCSPSDCSLREAIDAANANVGPDTIILPAGTYYITLIEGAPENANASGDLDITGPTTFIGAGSAATFIEANNKWRHFHASVYSGVDLTITGITFMNGTETADNGGCLFAQAGSVTLTDTVFTNCTGVAGGAVYKSANAATFTIDNSTFTQNHSTGTGGAIFSARGITINNSTFTNNRTDAGAFDAGAIYVGGDSQPSTITNSTLSNNFAGASGGAIYTNGYLTASNSTFNANTAETGNSGAMYIKYDADLSFVTIDGNTAGTLGGVSNVRAFTAPLDNATITNNSAGAYGGVFNVRAESNVLNITNSTINGNTAATYGGVLYTNGFVNVTDSTISNNTANGGNGGAMFVKYDVNLTRVTMEGNSAVGHGGAIHARYFASIDGSLFRDNHAIGVSSMGGALNMNAYSTSQWTVSNSTFANNTTTGYGGAYAAGQTKLAVKNSTFSGNTADLRGGALYVRLGCEITNSTLYGNSSADSGGVYRIDAGSVCTITNSIFANNTNGSCGPATRVYTSGGNNIEDDNTCAFGVAGDLPNTDPQLLSLANNYGGNTYVHALRATSPAVDGGNDAACAAAPINNLDQRGVVRPQDGNGVVDADGNECDIGAVEFEPYQLSAVITGIGRITSNVGGLDCPNDKCAVVFGMNDAVTLTAQDVPGSGYLFDNWSGACSGTVNTCDLIMDAGKDAIANYLPNPVTHNLAVTVSGPGSVTSSPGTINCIAATCNELFPEGTWVTLTPNPDVGYELLAWTGACSGNGVCVVTMDGAKSVSGTFALKQFNVTVEVKGYGDVASIPAGITCGDRSTCVGSFANGTSLTLIPAARPGFIFSGWSDDCAVAGTGNCVLTVDSDKSTIASFPTYRTGGVFMNSEHGGRDTTYPERAYYPAGDGVTGVSRAHIDPAYNKYPRGECYHCHEFENPNPNLDWPMTFTVYSTKEEKVDFCGNCHTDADPDANGVDGDTPNDFSFKGPTAFKNSMHYVRNLSWPGGQYGSDYPAMPAEGAGACINCHSPHAHKYSSDYASLPAGIDPSTIPFPKQLVELTDIVNADVLLNDNFPVGWPNVNGRDPDDAEDLCYTCHDGDPVKNKDLTSYNSYMKTAEAPESNNASSIKEAFELYSHHPVKDSEQQVIADAKGNSVPFKVECTTCHNPHLASGTWADIANDATATPLVLPRISNDWPRPAVAGYVKGEAWGDEPEEKVNALLLRMAQENDRARGTGGWAFNVARGYPLETLRFANPGSADDFPTDKSGFDQPAVYQPPYGGLGPEQGLQPDGDQLPDFLTFCLDCHQNNLKQGPIYWGARWPVVQDWNWEPHGFDPANLSNFACDAGCVEGSAPCLDIKSSYLDPSDPWYNKPEGRGYQTWSLPPYRMEDRIAGINYVLVCTDCHEPHGSARRNLLRDHINGNNIGPGGSENVCTSCHRDWGGVMVGYPGADACGNGTPVGCTNTACHGSLSVHRISSNTQAPSILLRDPNYVANSYDNVLACADNGPGLIGLWGPKNPEENGSGVDGSNNDAHVIYTLGTVSSAEIIDTRNGGNFRTARRECHSLRKPDTAWNSGSGNDPTEFTYEGKIKFVPFGASNAIDAEDSIEMSLIDYTLDGAGAGWAVRLSNRCCTADGNADGIADGDPSGDMYLQVMINVWDQDQVNPWRIAYSKVAVPKDAEGFTGMRAVAARFDASDPIAPLRVYIDGEDVTDGVNGNWVHDPADYNPTVINLYQQPVGMYINSSRHEDDCVVGDPSGAPDGNCVVTWDAKNLNPYIHFGVDATLCRPFCTDEGGNHNFWGYMGKQRLFNKALNADQICSDVQNTPGDSDWDTTIYSTNLAADCATP